MSTKTATKTATWGEIIKSLQQSKLESSKIDTTDKGEEKSAIDSSNDIIHTYGEENTDVNDSWETNDSGNSAFSTSDYLNAGVGHTIVCQVLPSRGAADLY